MWILKSKAFYTYIILAVVLVTNIIFWDAYYAATSVANKDETVGTKVPIIMYHSILKDENRSGQYVITPSQLEEDLKYMKDNGYTAILMQDLIDYVYDGKPLPPKPIILTFDDGYYNNYVYAYPLIKKYNSKAVISAIGKTIDFFTENHDSNANYSYINWDNIKEMLNSGLIEIQNHSYDLHTLNKGRSGSKRKIGESLEKYEKILKDDAGKLQELFREKTGYMPTTYTYAFGSISKESTDIFKVMGFKATLSCYKGMNYITRDPDCLFRLKRYIRPASKSLQGILD